jgi:sugar phosphate isomerase/epimerase
MASKEGLALFKKRLDLADALGVKYVNTAEGDASTEEAKEAFYTNVREAANYNKNIFICLETHGGLLGTSEMCKKTLEIIGCENVKMNYDPANLIYFEGKRPEEDIQAAVAFIGHFHIKDKLEGKGVWNFPEIGTGVLDFTKLFTVLKNGGYEGPLSFELEFDSTEGVESPEYVDNALKNSVKYVQSVVSSIGW